MEFVVATVSGYSGTERFKLIKLITETGANYVGALTKSTTHLVCWQFEGRKYRLAKKLGTKIVNHQWFEDCLKKRRCLSEDSYTTKCGQQVGPLLWELPVAAAECGKANDKLAKKKRPVLTDCLNMLNEVEMPETNTTSRTVGFSSWSHSDLFRPTEEAIVASKCKRFLRDVDQSSAPVKIFHKRHRFAKHSASTLRDNPGASCGANISNVGTGTATQGKGAGSKNGICLSDGSMNARAEENEDSYEANWLNGSGDISSVYMHQIASPSKHFLREDSMVASRSERSSRDVGQSSASVKTIRKGHRLAKISESIMKLFAYSGASSSAKYSNMETGTTSLPKRTGSKNGICLSDGSINTEAEENDESGDGSGDISSGNMHQTESPVQDLCGSDGNGIADLEKTKSEEISLPPTSTELSCVICWTEFSSTRGVLPCGHRFCYSCIQNWADHMASKRKVSACPLCKASFTSIRRVEDVAPCDQKIYSQTLPCTSASSVVFIVPEKEVLHAEIENSSASVCYKCRNREPEDLLLSCHFCRSRWVHSFCLDPPSFPWTCIHCKDLRMLYHRFR